MALMLGLFGLLGAVLGTVYGVREVVWMGLAFVGLAAVVRFLEPKAAARRKAMGAVSSPVALPRRPYRRTLSYRARGIAMLAVGILWTVALVLAGTGWFALTGGLFIAAGVIQTVGSFRK